MNFQSSLPELVGEAQAELGELSPNQAQVLLNLSRVGQSFFSLEMTPEQVECRVLAAMEPRKFREGIILRPDPTLRPMVVNLNKVVYPELARGKITLPEVVEQTGFLIGSERL